MSFSYGLPPSGSYVAYAPTSSPPTYGSYPLPAAPSPTPSYPSHPSSPAPSSFSPYSSKSADGCYTCVLFVSGLPKEWSETELRYECTKYGTPLQVYIVPQPTKAPLSTGFAFVTYGTPQEAAYALQYMNQQMYGTNQVMIRYAYPTCVIDDASIPYWTPFKVEFVARDRTPLHKEVLEKLADFYGPVKNVVLHTKRPHTALVEFSTGWAATAAYNHVKCYFPTYDLQFMNVQQKAAPPSAPVQMPPATYPPPHPQGAWQPPAPPAPASPPASYVNPERQGMVPQAPKPTILPPAKSSRILEHNPTRRALLVKKLNPDLPVEEFYKYFSQWGPIDSFSERMVLTRPREVATLLLTYERINDAFRCHDELLGRDCPMAYNNEKLKMEWNYPPSHTSSRASQEDDRKRPEYRRADRRSYSRSRSRSPPREKIKERERDREGERDRDRPRPSQPQGVQFPRDRDRHEDRVSDEERTRREQDRKARFLRLGRKEGLIYLEGEPRLKESLFCCQEAPYQKPSSRLYISNMNHSITQPEIMRILEVFGTVLDHKCHYSQIKRGVIGSVFVTYEKPEQAWDAMQHLRSNPHLAFMDPRKGLSPLALTDSGVYVTWRD